MYGNPELEYPQRDTIVRAGPSVYVKGIPVGQNGGHLYASHRITNHRRRRPTTPASGHYKCTRGLACGVGKWQWRG